MKKLNYLLGLLFILTTILSCEKGGRISELLRDDVPYVGGAEFVFIGGNVECGDPGVILPGLVPVAPFSSGRLNYMGDGEFDGNWPEGLVVTVRPDNKTVDFYLTDEAQFCVGAVIVKGGNGAIVYKYPNGTRGDVGLTSPLNSSYQPADLSNLTFCFVKCENLVIAVKVWYNNNSLWGATTGKYVFFSSWCRQAGINTYPFTEPLILEQAYTDTQIGTVSLINGKIKISLNQGLTLTSGYIYIGTEEDLITPVNFINGCPDYTNDWIPYVDWDPAK